MAVFWYSLMEILQDNMPSIFYKEKKGKELLEEAQKLGVALDGIETQNYLREAALQQRVREAKNTRYAQLGWLLALVSAIASAISALAAWIAVGK
ncbi:MAG: hypothetical protein AAB793_00825 [Patescibacteria group bacterium]